MERRSSCRPRRAFFARSRFTGPPAAYTRRGMSSSNFFDFQQQVTRRRGRAASPAAPEPANPGEQPLTVSQLTAKITKVVRTGMPPGVLVKGEVSNYRPNASSGHVYFTLKDAESCIDCVIFK